MTSLSISCPLCSVITICYNDLEGLKRTTSRLLQLKASSITFRIDIEFILIDGDSTDGSLEYALSQNLFNIVKSERQWHL